LKIVDSWEVVDELHDALTGVVSFDIETTGLYPWTGDVVSIGFGTHNEQYIVPLNHKECPWDDRDKQRIIGMCHLLMADCTTVMHNGKFDALWMLQSYGRKFHIGFDTMLAHYLCDENSRHDLETVAKSYLGAAPWDIPLKEKQGNAPFEKIATYHAADLHYTRLLYFRLRDELRKDPLVNRVFDRILMPCANLFVEIEHLGCFVDLPRMDIAEKYLLTEMETCLKSLREFGDINWGSTQQIAKLLFGDLKIPIVERTAKGAASTNESCLKRITHPAVAALLRYRSARQTHSFFIKGWKPYIVDGRLHPSFKLHGTVTGRLSCQHPNFQQVPRDPRIRSLITAPPGWVFIEADLSQIELRIVAQLSQVPAMVKAYRDGIDIHWLTALTELQRGAGEQQLIRSTSGVDNYGEAIEKLLRMGPDQCCTIDKRWKEIRKKAKAVNFGYVYGMWWKKFKTYARDSYDLHLTDDQARESREAFFDLYPLDGWHKSQQRFARENGYVRSLSGRKRRLPAAQSAYDTPERGEAWRQAINSPVQSFANDLNLMVLLQMSEEFPREQFRPVMTVHDQIGAEVAVKHVRSVVTRMEEIMRSPALLDELGIKLSIPIMGETKVGPWGSGVTLEEWDVLRIAV
jgi:DNA polymerase I-like protein with 3'-5' exonuclease and polymerase domains